VSFEEQIKSKDKYPNIFSGQIKATFVLCLLSFKYFSQQESVLKNKGFPSFSREKFSQVTSAH